MCARICAAGCAPSVCFGISICSAPRRYYSVFVRVLRVRMFVYMAQPGATSAPDRQQTRAGRVLTGGVWCARWTEGISGKGLCAME